MDLYRRVLESPDPDAGLVLGTVIEAAGSTPQKPGCQALLGSESQLTGTLGGGLVEAQAINLMRAALQDLTPRVFEKRLDETYSRDAGPICGGVMRIFVNPRVQQHRAVIAEALAALDRRERGFLLTHVSEGARQGVIEWRSANNGFADQPESREALERILLEERPGVVTMSDDETLFVEPLKPLPRLLVVGGGHVGQEVVRQAAALGFETTVVDDRPEFARPQLFPDGVRSLHGNIRELVVQYPKDKDTYIVLVSKGHKPDAEALEACIHDAVGYLGMIGSKRKVRLLRKDFLEQGLATQDELDRVVAPIGYDIGAITVPEIGVSIAAQLVAARRHPAAVRDIAIKAL